MKILVAVKHAVGYVHTMNPYDAVAVEQALCLREKGMAKEIVVVSIGTSVVQGTLRAALAMGADKAVCVCTETETTSLLQPLAVAKILRVLVEVEKPHLVILGRQAVGSEYGQTGQMLAALLAWPQATFVTQVDVSGSDKLEITREMAIGVQVLEVELPAVITVELCLQTPRHIGISQFIRAEQKPIQTLLLKDMAVDIEPRLVIEKLTPVQKRRAGVKVNSVDELLHKLRYEARVL